MAVRVVYTMPNKAPDVVQEAESWTFGDDTLKIWGKGDADGPMIEIRRDVVFSIERFELADDAKPAPEEPKKAVEGPKKAKRASKKAKETP